MPAAAIPTRIPPGFQRGYGNGGYGGGGMLETAAAVGAGVIRGDLIADALVGGW